MLQLFSKNHIVNTLAFLPLIIIFHFSVFVREDVYMFHSDAGAYLGSYICDFFASSPIIGGIITCFLIFIQIILLNRIAIINKLSNSITLYTGMVYLILTILIPQFLVLSPAVLAVTFLLLSLSNLMYSFKIKGSPGHVFNTGFWLAVASLCYSGITVFLIWGFIGFTILRRFRTKEGMRYLVGFIVPYIWTMVIAYFQGDYMDFIQTQFVDNIGFPEIDFTQDLLFYVPAIIFALFTIFSFLNYGQYMRKKIIQSQKKISIIFWFLAFALVSIFLTYNVDMTHLYFLAIPLSFFLSESLVSLENKSVGELLAWVFIALGIIYQYGILG